MIGPRNHCALRMEAGARLVCALFVVLIPWCTPASEHGQSTPSKTQGSANAAYDVPSLTAELARISSLLEKKPAARELTALRDSLPAQWTVTTPEKEYAISTEFLRGQLNADSTSVARQWVEHLKGQLESYTATRPPGTANSRAELDGILGGPEFAAVHPPTRWDIFRQRVAAWLERLLLRLFGGLARYPITGQILFWAIVVLCVGFLALWVFRWTVSRDRIDALPPGHISAPTLTWQEWIRAARLAAGKNDFREAIHSAYWAGITRLEDTGMLPKDRTKTPREYLRLILQPSPREQFSAAAYREPLTALTNRLERTWYGNRAASGDDFRETLQQVEALGCQLE
jgi:Domain of unknown function (DUF4129)